MKKAINLYFSIFNWSADYVINAMEEHTGEEFTMRINSPGGDVFAGWGIAAKMRETPAKVVAKVDGIAASMAAFLLLFADEVHMSTMGRVMIHRADGPVRNDQDQQFLDGVNADLKKALKAKIDSKKLKELKGVSIEQIFNPEGRIDVWLSAKEAKAIGLVDKVIKLAPAKLSALEDFTPSIAAMGFTAPPVVDTYEEKGAEAVESTPVINNKNNKSIMTAEQFQREHPEAYASILKGAASAERDRVNAWLKFMDVDAEAVKKGIEDGEPLGQTAIADFMAKIAKNTATANLKAEAAGTTTTEEEPKPGDAGASAEPTELENFMAKVNEYLPKAEAKK